MGLNARRNVIGRCYEKASVSLNIITGTDLLVVTKLYLNNETRLKCVGGRNSKRCLVLQKVVGRETGTNRLLQAEHPVPEDFPGTSGHRPGTMCPSDPRDHGGQCQMKGQTSSYSVCCNTDTRRNQQPF